jgi:hypothetical protein
MDVSKYTWMRDGCILVVEISSFKDGVFKTFLKSDEYAKEPTFLKSFFFFFV